MINRHYFISAKCGKNDGSGSYSFYWGVFIMKSFRPNYNAAFDEGLNTAKKTFNDKGLDSSAIEVLAFNRIK